MKFLYCIAFRSTRLAQSTSMSHVSECAMNLDMTSENFVIKVNQKAIPLICPVVTCSIICPYKVVYKSCQTVAFEALQHSYKLRK